MKREVALSAFGTTLDSWQLFLFFIVVLWFASFIGSTVIARLRNPQSGESEDVRMILGAMLTLLGLTIGFTLSMAIGGYNIRQNNEAAEAVAISTALSRVDLLPAERSTTLRPLLAQYLEQRLRFYGASDHAQLQTVDEETSRLKAELWLNVVDAAHTKPTPLSALAVSGVSDVLTSEATTNAGWRSQIPLAAWGLMTIIAACCNLLVGYSAGRNKHRALLFMLPFVISVSFSFIGDIDVPGRGLIHVSSVNLERAAGAFHEMGLRD